MKIGEQFIDSLEFSENLADNNNAKISIFHFAFSEILWGPYFTVCFVFFLLL